jgi:hypothetical protein
LLRLTETGSRLVLDYPAWLGLVLIGLGAALAIHLVRRFDWKARTVSLLAATALCFFGGLYFLTYRCTLTPEDGRVFVFPGHRQRVEWTHAESIATEQRTGRGTSTWIVVRAGAGSALEINVTGLSGGDEQRVREYVAARMKK